MSRQRIRTGVLEGSTIVCPHCAGSGMMRSAASIALHILRVLEDALIKNAQYNLIVRARSEVALYILNQKRSHLHDIEARFGVSIIVAGDETLTGTVHHALERGDLASPPPELRRSDLVRIDSITPEDIEEEVEEIEEEEETEEADDSAEGDAESESDGEVPGETGKEAEARRRRRRRRRRGGRNDREGGFLPTDAPQPSDNGMAIMAEIAGDIPASLADATVSDGDSDEAEAEGFDAEGNGEEAGRRRRRSRRGGRNRRRDREDGEGEATSETGSLEEGAPLIAGPADDFAPAVESPAAPVEIEAPAFAQPHVHVEPHAEIPAPVRETPPPLPEAPIDPNRPKRSGWWQRAKQSFGG